MVTFAIALSSPEKTDMISENRVTFLMFSMNDTPCVGIERLLQTTGWEIFSPLTNGYVSDEHNNHNTMPNNEYQRLCECVNNNPINFKTCCVGPRIFISAEIIFNFSQLIPIKNKKCLAANWFRIECAPCFYTLRSRNNSLSDRPSNIEQWARNACVVYFDFCII